MKRQPAVIFGVAATALLALLTVFAVEIVESQSNARNDVQSRFRDRAKASAALTESLFSSASATAQAENAKRFGAAHVSSKTLGARARQGNNAYLIVLSDEGKVIASSPGTSGSVKRKLEAKPEYIRNALKGQLFTVSNVQRTGPVSTMDFTQSFKTAFGRRLIVSGLNAEPISQFLGGYLEQIPNVEGGRAYVLDQRGRIVASPVKGTTPGAIVKESGLVAALAKGPQGNFDGGRYRVSDTVKGTPWRVVLTAPNGKLFASVNGTRKWVPWILFTAFGLAAVVALLLLRRVLLDARRLTAANSQLGDANLTLERRARELTHSNEQLDRFASIASHDLQEPLRKLQTFAERLVRQEQDRLSDSGRDYLGRMSSAAQRMQDLIEGLLAYSRATTQIRSTERVELTELVNEIVSDLELAISDTGATVEVGELPIVPADPLRMRQLFQNLIANGLKFHREGVPPVVRIEGRTNAREAEISVIDNGIGFEPRFAGRIFRVFERLHGRGVYPGTGIGLALCRMIVERHGGTLTAESTPGQGSTFTVALPLKPVDVIAPSNMPSETTEEEKQLVTA